MRAGWRAPVPGGQHSGVSAPAQLAAVASNARALAARGDLRGAEAMLDQVLEPAAATLGADHPEVLAATRLLASLRRGLGDLSGARRILEEALAAGQFTLGEDSAALLPFAYDLATLAAELGNRHEARRNYTRLLRYGPAALGPDHEYVRAARGYLGVSATPQAPAAPATPSAPAAPPTPPTPAPDPPVGPIYVPAPTPPPTSAPPTSAPPVYSPPPPPRLTPPPGYAPPPPPGPGPGGQPRGWDHPDDHRHSRAPMLALVLVAAMALIGGGIAAYLVLRNPGDRPGPQPSATVAADEAKPPGDLKLRDEGSAVTLTWSDPSDGTVPFIVSAGRPGSALKLAGQVESGRTSFRLDGLPPSADYCFLVTAIYPPNRAVPSSLVCTQRTAASPSQRR